MARSSGRGLAMVINEMRIAEPLVKGCAARDAGATTRPIKNSAVIVAALAWRGCSHRMGGAMKHARCSPRSTTGSPEASTQRI